MERQRVFSFVIYYQMLYSHCMCYVMLCFCAFFQQTLCYVSLFKFDRWHFGLFASVWQHFQIYDRCINEWKGAWFFLYFCFQIKRTVGQESIRPSKRKKNRLHISTWKFFIVHICIVKLHDLFIRIGSFALHIIVFWQNPFYAMKSGIQILFWPNVI